MLLIDGSLILLNSKEDNIDVIWLSSSKSEFVNFCNKVGMSLNIAPCHFFQYLILFFLHILLGRDFSSFYIFCIYLNFFSPLKNENKIKIYKNIKY